MNNFFIDAEADGLYGNIIAIGVIVLDENDEETDVFNAKIDLSVYTVTDEWTKENVIPLLTNDMTTYNNEYDLLEAFWKFYLKYRENSNCISDVSYPVEAGLFRKCIEHDLDKRKLLGPYPLIDLSNLLFFKKIDPLTERTSLADAGLERHNPLNDVRITARIWRQLYE